MKAMLGHTIFLLSFSKESEQHMYAHEVISREK